MKMSGYHQLNGGNGGISCTASLKAAGWHQRHLKCQPKWRQYGEMA
jgi:hypothetical protein